MKAMPSAMCFIGMRLVLGSSPYVLSMQYISLASQHRVRHAIHSHSVVAQFVLSVSPVTHKLKKYILPTFQRANVYVMY